jgi:hypothetical protein
MGTTNTRMLTCEKDIGAARLSRSANWHANTPQSTQLPCEDDDLKMDATGQIGTSATDKYTHQPTQRFT